MMLPFVKMHGAGNDFVVVDHREPLLPADDAARRPLFAALCDRRRGVGADGVLLLERSASADFAMRYYNSDGGAADFCGNGARCIARFALDLKLGASGTVRFETAVGEKSARLLDDGRVALEFGVVTPGEDREVAACGRTFAGRFVVTGVPHFVVGVADVATVDFAEWSPALRAQDAFGASGANVDWAARRADGRVDMRTWERGVEGETLACGSGAIATALWAVAAGVPAPVTVRTAGGDDLVVAFADTPQGRRATLTGPAVVVFGGAWPLG
ncbi:MAG: diaminopimelate epimerase [Candidatus Eisenbacteria bacterium]